MPDDLKAIVQRMIDAGEPEENIGKVIKGYTPPYQPRNILAEGRASAATSGSPEATSGFQDWFNNELKPVLEKVARPETISDIAALLVPDAAGVVVGARAASRAVGAGTSAVGKAIEAIGASSGMRRASNYGAAGAALHGNFVPAAVAVGVPPTLRGTGRVIQGAGQFMQDVGARPVAEAAQIAAETPAELTARLTAENAAAHGNVKPDLAATLEARPAAPQAQAPTPAPVASPAPAGPAQGPQLVETPRANGTSYLLTKNEAGSVGGEVSNGQLRINHASVDPALQGQGRGQELYRHIIDKATDRGLSVVSDNTVEEPAARVYEALAKKGYTVTRNPNAFELTLDDGSKGLGAPPGESVFSVKAPSAAPMSTPEAFKAALNAFDTAKVAPQAAEVNNAAMLIKRGVAPDEALKTVLGNRPPAPANPAAELAKRLGTPSEAEMNADMARRARRGQKSLMPKYGGGDPPKTGAAGVQAAPPAPPKVDGRIVRPDVPNMSSIESSFNNYEVLPGVREVKMSDFDPAYKPKPYSVSEDARLNKLTQDIAANKEISPLIVVVDKEAYPYILEGGHRFDALKQLNAKSFPAIVVRDLDSIGGKP